MSTGWWRMAEFHQCQLQAHMSGHWKAEEFSKFIQVASVVLRGLIPRNPTLAFAFLARYTIWCSQNGSELRGEMKTNAHILNSFYGPMQFYTRTCMASRLALKMLNTHSICQKMLIDIQHWTITGIIFMNGRLNTTNSKHQT